MTDLRDAARRPIRSPQDLRDRWSSLMGELQFSRHSLWFTFVDSERRMFPHITEIVDIPPAVGRGMTSDLITMVAHLVGTEDDLASVAFLLSRPGGAMNDDDRSWARALTATARFQRVRVETVHLATTGTLTAFSPDDLAA